ncbi:hypothetical protein FVR03_21680 [Pontibacter qinzhouensis]|uniref:Uncharacterized protein n=1 Tax=Pontibacter qinzhouensis TaxID=2603253 RepID=A0A5C8IZK3_9BACT|nr:hypothetical protein [Pontibacter qinzhouensis]TXK26536.1 hypothetical protein FVR03_21680 [Pontibacter qinzhouensis]
MSDISKTFFQNTDNQNFENLKSFKVLIIKQLTILNKKKMTRRERRKQERVINKLRSCKNVRNGDIIEIDGVKVKIATGVEDGDNFVFDEAPGEAFDIGQAFSYTENQLRAEKAALRNKSVVFVRMVCPITNKPTAIVFPPHYNPYIEKQFHTGSDNYVNDVTRMVNDWSGHTGFVNLILSKPTTEMLDETKITELRQFINTMSDKDLVKHYNSIWGKNALKTTWLGTIIEKPTVECEMDPILDSSHRLLFENIVVDSSRGRYLYGYRRMPQNPDGENTIFYWVYGSNKVLALDEQPDFDNQVGCLVLSDLAGYHNMVDYMPVELMTFC